MPNYRRDYSGTCWFFTVVTAGRRHLLTDDGARRALRDAVRACRARYPFTVDAWVLLPDHLHCIWTLPPEDRDYSRRWSLIKRRFSQAMCRPKRGDTVTATKGDSGYWQRRFWAHRIDDQADYNAHVDYIHINPVKHGLVQQVRAWPRSTFHRFVTAGVLPADWGGEVRQPGDVGRE